jgi:small subunit ribosomal protein S20
VAHSLSAKKRFRQNVKRRALNRARTSALRTKLRKCRDLFVHGTVDQAEEACRIAFRALDREADRGTLHSNAAARRKSRMARRLNAMRQAVAS